MKPSPPDHAISRRFVHQFSGGKEVRVTGKVPKGATVPDPQLNLPKRKKEKKDVVSQVKCPEGLRHLVDNLVCDIYKKKRMKNYYLTGKVP